MNKKEYIHHQTMYFQNACKEEPRFLGAELEHFLVELPSMRSYTYYEPDGQKDLVERLSQKGWEVFLSENEYPLGIKKSGHTITFEPGGQFEISLAPFASVAEIDKAYRQVLSEIEAQLKPHQALVSIGYHPSTQISDLPLLPKKRYAFMFDYFKTHGDKGHYMMKGTAATQVSIDFTSEADFIKKFRVAHFLAPVLSSLFDATPIFEGHVHSKGNLRTQIWLGTDKPRSKLVKGTLDKVFGFADYVKYLLSLSPIFIPKEGVYETFDGQPLEAFVENWVWSLEDFEHVQSMVFPDVRLKKYLEIRMADAMPYPYNMSFMAVIETIFYDVDLLNEWYSLSLKYDDAWVEKQNDFLARGDEEALSELLDLKVQLLHALKKHMKVENKVYFEPFEKLIQAHGSLASWLKKLYLKDADQFAKAIRVTGTDLETPLMEWTQPDEKLSITDYVLAHSEKYEADCKLFLEGVSKSKAIYKGEPVPTLYVPMIYNQADIETFDKALEGMRSVVNTTIDLYMNHPHVRQLFGFDERLEALIMQPHYYEAKVPMGRFDIFYYGNGHYMFCELNADGASAMNEQKELARVWETTALKSDLEVARKWTFDTYELFDTWVEEVRHLYKSFSSNAPFVEREKEAPFVAILDFVDKSSPIEFIEFKKAFEEGGFKCDIVDPRHIKINDGFMTYENQVIDVVYRRLVTKDLMDHYEEIPDFIEGLMANKTCVIGSLKTQIVHSKRFFEVLHHPDIRRYFSGAQRVFIEKHVPFTSKLSFKETYISRKDDYIIKPVDYYASKGVCAGQDYDEATWTALLKEKSQEDYIVQRYCPLSLVENVLYNKESGFEKHAFKTITGLFTYNEKLSGVYVRAGLNAIISGLHDGYTLPTFIASEK